MNFVCWYYVQTAPCVGTGPFSERDGPALLQFKASMLDEPWEPANGGRVLKSDAVNAVDANNIRFVPTKDIQYVLQEMGRTLKTLDNRLTIAQKLEWELLLHDVENGPGQDCNTCHRIRESQRTNSARSSDNKEERKTKAQRYNQALIDLRSHLRESDDHCVPPEITWPFCLGDASIVTGRVPVDRDGEGMDCKLRPQPLPQDVKGHDVHSSVVVDDSTAVVEVKQQNSKTRAKKNGVKLMLHIDELDHDIVELMNDEAGPLMSIGRRKKKRKTRKPLHVGDIVAVRKDIAATDGRFYMGVLRQWTEYDDGRTEVIVQWLTNETHDMIDGGPIRLAWFVNKSGLDKPLESFDKRRPKNSTRWLSDPPLYKECIITWFAKLSDVFTTKERISATSLRDIQGRLSESIPDEAG